MDSKEQAKIAEDTEEISDCLKYLCTRHKNAHDILKVNSAMGYCYAIIGQSF